MFLLWVILACFRTFHFLRCSNVALRIEWSTKMGTITIRHRDDRSPAYRAQIRMKVKGRIVHQETQTFDRRQAASAWIAKRETELRQPGALDRIRSAENDPPLR